MDDAPLPYLPMTYAAVLFVASMVLFLSICYLGLLLRSKEWIQKSIDALPTLHPVIGVLTLFGGVGALLITPQDTVVGIVGYISPFGLLELRILAAAMIIFAFANLFAHFLKYWFQVFVLFGTFMTWFLLMLLAIPSLHHRAIFWLASANSVITGFALVTKTMFGKRE